MAWGAGRSITIGFDDAIGLIAMCVPDRPPLLFGIRSMATQAAELPQRWQEMSYARSNAYLVRLPAPTFGVRRLIPAPVDNRLIRVRLRYVMLDARHAKRVSKATVQ